MATGHVLVGLRGRDNHSCQAVHSLATVKDIRGGQRQSHSLVILPGWVGRGEREKEALQPTHFCSQGGEMRKNAPTSACFLQRCVFVLGGVHQSILYRREGWWKRERVAALSVLLLALLLHVGEREGDESLFPTDVITHRSITYTTIRLHEQSREATETSQGNIVR